MYVTISTNLISVLCDTDELRPCELTIVTLGLLTEPREESFAAAVSASSLHDSNIDHINHTSHAMEEKVEVSMRICLSNCIKRALETAT